MAPIQRENYSTPRLPGRNRPVASSVGLSSNDQCLTTHSRSRLNGNNLTSLRIASKQSLRVWSVFEPHYFNRSALLLYHKTLTWSCKITISPSYLPSEAHTKCSRVQQMEWPACNPSLSSLIYHGCRLDGRRVLTRSLERRNIGRSHLRQHRKSDVGQAHTLRHM